MLAPWSDQHDETACPTARDPADDLDRAQRIATIRRAVMTLPLRYREVVLLCDLQELSYHDAAAALHCAVGTVRSRLHRGRALLAAKLKEGSDGRKPAVALA
jgi:RNA polymerase sigma-70 factor (ECF subfamily)